MIRTMMIMIIIMIMITQECRMSSNLLGLEEHDLLLHAGVEAEHGGHAGGPGAHIVTTSVDM